MSTSSSSSSTTSSTFSSTAAAAPPAAAAGPAEAGPETLVSRDAISYPTRALAKRPGQYPSTAFPVALITLLILSPYTDDVEMSICSKKKLELMSLLFRKEYGSKLVI